MLIDGISHTNMPILREIKTKASQKSLRMHYSKGFSSIMAFTCHFRSIWGLTNVRNLFDIITWTHFCVRMHEML